MPSSLRLRRDIQSLVDEAEVDLRVLWRQADTFDRARSALFDVVPGLVSSYGAMAATIAAEFYDEYREERSPRGRRFEAIPADIRDSGAEALIGWSLSEAQDMTALQTLVLGGVQRRIANFSRATMADSSLSDPAAKGWIRVGYGECDWCQQYLDGEIRTAPGYDFPAHDHCRCDAVPAF